MAREVLDICLKIILCKHQLDRIKTVGGINFSSSRKCQKCMFFESPIATVVAMATPMKYAQLDPKPVMTTKFHRNPSSRFGGIVFTGSQTDRQTRTDNEGPL